MYKRKVNKFICTETEPVVSTTAGQLRGFKSDDVYNFRGIEYAQSKRFHMPEPVAPWEGVKDALNYGYGCPEMTYSLRERQDLDLLIVPGRIWAVSENCQNLNVWTKSISPSAKRPVMVWLHGGGFFGGSATHLYSYDGYEMANENDVVVVTVNHRLNMLGFLDLSAYGTQYQHSGNAGMADLVAALQWVCDNVANFGGDPDNVTIYGQSGGGGKVTTLMQMPSADGLYHRAIIQSGVMRMAKSSDSARQLTAKTVEVLGLNSQNITEIETMDYDIVASAIKKASAELGGSPMGMWAPVPDGEYFVGAPLNVGFRPETRHIPVMVGHCLAEFPSCLPKGDKTQWTDEQRFNCLKESFGDGAEEVKSEFIKAYPEVDWSYAVAADFIVRPAVLEFLDQRCAQADAPAYSYVFTFESPLMGGQLPGHNGELHFMFHNAAYMDAMSKPGTTERLQDEMAGAWAQFAYAGNPNRAGLPMWEAYTPDNGACMAFGDVTVLKHGHDLGLMEAFKKYPPKTYML